MATASSSRSAAGSGRGHFARLVSRLLELVEGADERRDALRVRAMRTF
jgi:hypothetical protein